MNSRQARPVRARADVTGPDVVQWVLIALDLLAGLIDTVRMWGTEGRV